MTGDKDPIEHRCSRQTDTSDIFSHCPNIFFRRCIILRTEFILSVVIDVETSISIDKWEYSFYSYLNLLDPKFDFIFVLDFKLGNPFLHKSKFMNKKFPTFEDIAIIIFMDELEETDNDYNKGLP